MSLDFSRGSEWRKWDLHVHTPESVLNNEYGSDWDCYVKNLFNEAIKCEIAAIGVTDYFSIAGYKKLKSEYLSNESKLRELFSFELSEDPSYIEKIHDIFVFPNVELRLDTVVQNKEGKDSKLQYHVLFSNDLSEIQIEEKFLHQLSFSSIATITLGTDKSPLTKNSLELFGKRLKEHQPEFSSKSDYEIGCMCAAVSFDEITNVLKKVANEFADKYLLVLVEEAITDINWNGQAHQIRKTIYSNSNAIFSSNSNTIKWGLREDTKKEFSSYKACLWGSDAHSFSKLFRPDKNRYCWIKADLTFSGLNQVIYQPHDRVYIGTVPPKLDKLNKNVTKYLKCISVNKNVDALNTETWFGFQIPLNPGLVAVIGSKGSGKSAFSDIIGFLCQCSSMDYASFLHKDRFRKEDKKYANDYSAEISWYDQHNIQQNSLYSSSDDYGVEKAKYLPQKYIELVCSNLGDEFQNEINDVIFSYIDKSEKGNCSSLSSLIDHKSEQIIEDIRIISNQMDTINSNIIDLEDKSSLKYQKDIKNKLKHFEEELERLIANKPQEVADPSKAEDVDKAKRIIEIDKLVVELDQEIEKVKNSLYETNEALYEIELINAELKRIQNDITNIQERYSIFAQKYDLPSDVNLISVNFKADMLNTKNDELKSTKQILNQKLYNPLEEGYLDTDTEVNKEELSQSLFIKRQKLEDEKESLIAQTSAEQQRYQKYLDDLKEWEYQKNSIIGDSTTENTISYYKEEVKYLSENLQTDRKKLESERIELIKKIYQNYKKVAQIYENLYMPIKHKLHTILNEEEDSIEFSADIVAKKQLGDEILKQINKSAKGAFRGVAEANALIDRLIRSTNFNSEESLLSFFTDIMGKLTLDYDEISKVIPNRYDLYEYLSNLKYLKVDYTLKLGNKTLTELSPGERGTVLLVFYLALSRENIPLIIDQPEDNLDNQSVYNRLVPCIVEAKKHRQVIIVTHNPNIAVACDAEQIIYCSIDKKNNNISYCSGSIENPEIRKKVIDVLEGTMPAFDLRKLKYTEEYNGTNTTI